MFSPSTSVKQIVVQAGLTLVLVVIGFSPIRTGDDVAARNHSRNAAAQTTRTMVGGWRLKMTSANGEPTAALDSVQV